MKKIALVAVVVVLMMGLAGSAIAANSLAQGAKGISVGMGDSIFSHASNDYGQAGATQNPVIDISGRYFISKDTALTFGAGLQLNSSDLEGTYLSLSFGARRYLTTNDFAPFVGGQLSYATWDRKNAAGAKVVDASVFDLVGFIGAEYFFHKQFSVEGAIGVGLGQASNDLPANQGGGDTTYIGTRTMGVKANFYF